MALSGAFLCEDVMRFSRDVGSGHIEGTINFPD